MCTVIIDITKMSYVPLLTEIPPNNELYTHIFTFRSRFYLEIFISSNFQSLLVPHTIVCKRELYPPKLYNCLLSRVVHIFYKLCFSVDHSFPLYSRYLYFLFVNYAKGGGGGGGDSETFFSAAPSALTIF